MPIREIARESWAPFLESFTLQHELWRVTMKFVNTKLEPRPEFRELPLVRINLIEDMVSITLLDQDKKTKITKVIKAPAHLWLEETESGAHKSLQIDLSNGSRTILTFRSAVLPEELNGVLDDQYRSDTGQ